MRTDAQAEAVNVPLDGFVMHLRPSEVHAVATGLPGLVDADNPRSQTALVAALRALPVSDRAPLWELAIRHYARRKPLSQAAGEIGMDTLHARALVDALARALAE
jgi:hypothetical protein